MKIPWGSLLSFAVLPSFASFAIELPFCRPQFLPVNLASPSSAQSHWNVFCQLALDPAPTLIYGKSFFSSPIRLLLRPSVWENVLLFLCRHLPSFLQSQWQRRKVQEGSEHCWPKGHGMGWNSLLGWAMDGNDGWGHRWQGNDEPVMEWIKEPTWSRANLAPFKITHQGMNNF